MAKRIVTKIGDIFCAKIGDREKCYFQYVANDLCQLNSSVIRVFTTHYTLEAEPDIGVVVEDKIAFYAHTILRDGILNNAWYKVGRSNDIGEKDLIEVLFGQTQEFNTIIENTPNGFPSIQLTPINPLDNWYVWHVSEKSIPVGKLSPKYIAIIELGPVFPYPSIVDRMQYGYYKGTHKEYDLIKRIPRNNIDSYIKKYYEDETILRYLHFVEQTVTQEIVVLSNLVVKLSKGNPSEKGYNLYDSPFGYENWKHDEFITAEEFYLAWDNPDRLKVVR